MKLTAPQRGVLASFAFLLISMLSAQALAFDDGGLSYDIINTTDVEVTGRALGNPATDIVIPAIVVDSGITYSVTNIGEYAFAVNGLTSVVIPDSVTTIGEGAFYTNDLTSVIIPDSVTTIGVAAFAVNTLTSVTIGNSVETIGGSAFYNNALTSVTIGNSVETIGGSAFRSNNLNTVTIPNSVTTIGGSAFRTSSLTSVTIPDSVTTIGVSAFGSNDLTSVAFLGDFGTFRLEMFQDNPDLATITYAQGATGWPKTFTPNTGQTGSVTATAPPATPAPPTATAGDSQASVTWTKPADGGSTITGYTVTSAPGSNTCTTSDADTLTCDVTGLTNGTAYTYTVTAMNGVGTSAASAPSSSVTPEPPVPPATPQITSTDYGDDEIYLTVSVANNGGSTISSYTATCTDGTTQYTGTSSTSRITVSGLTNGVGYSCSVTATNAAGTSTSSATSPPIVPEYIPVGLPTWLLYEASKPASP